MSYKLEAPPTTAPADSMMSRGWLERMHGYITGLWSRIYGVFSGSPHSSRTLFQNWGTNLSTIVGAIPNGTATTSGFTAYNSSDADNAGILFMSCDPTTGGFLQTTSTGTGTVPTFSIFNAATSIFALDAAGKLTLSGGQIAFPAAQVASAGANVLDDYEEGTFTPTIGGTLTNGTYTYTTQQGRYVKIGGVVFFELEVTVNAITVAATGGLRILGLPFTANNNAGIVSNPYANGWNTAPFGGLIFSGNAFVDLYKLTSAVTFNRGGAAPADVAAACDIWVGGHYFTA